MDTITFLSQIFCVKTIGNPKILSRGHLFRERICRISEIAYEEKMVQIICPKRRLKK